MKYLLKFHQSGSNVHRQKCVCSCVCAHLVPLRGKRSLWPLQSGSVWARRCARWLHQRGAAGRCSSSPLETNRRHNVLHHLRLTADKHSEGQRQDGDVSSPVMVCQRPLQRDSSGVKEVENSPLPVLTDTVTYTHKHFFRFCFLRIMS